MGCNDYNSNCKDSCDQIDGLFEAASNLVQYRDIIEKWLHGGQGETVTIGGKDVSTLLGLIAQIKQLIGVLPDGKTIILDDVEKVLSVFLISGGGIRVKKEGGLYVDVDDILVLGGGLAKDEDGKIYVDFSQMPTDKFEALLRQIRVPIWLKENTTFYVRKDGSDSNSGFEDTPQGAWLTLQHAVNYLAANYNIDTHTATIQLGPGVWNEKILFPTVSASTGVVLVRGVGKAKTAFALDRAYQFLFKAGSSWIFDNLTINTTGEDADGAIIVENANVTITNIEHTGIRRNGVVWTASTGGNLSILEGCSFQNEVVHFISATNSGRISLDNPISFSGSASGGGVSAQSGGSIQRNGITLPVMTGNFSGKNYYATLNGVIRVFGGGPDFFPGSEPGVLDTGGQYA